MIQSKSPKAFGGSGIDTPTPMIGSGSMPRAPRTNLGRYGGGPIGAELRLVNGMSCSPSSTASSPRTHRPTEERECSDTGGKSSHPTSVELAVNVIEAA
jgi:hypothetical protein